MESKFQPKVEVITVSPETKPAIKITISQPDIVETITEEQVNQRIKMYTQQIASVKENNDRQIASLQEQLDRYVNIKEQLEAEKEKSTTPEEKSTETVNP